MNLHTRAPGGSKTRRGIGRLAVLTMMAGFLLGACDNKSNSDAANSSPPKAKTSEQPVAALAQKPQAELEQMFSSATGVLLSVKTSEQFAAIKPYNEASLTVQPNGLKIVAQGSDPAVLLPSFPSDEAIAEVIIDSPADTTFQLFYRLPGMANFSQSDSISVPIKAGKNTIYVHIPAATGVLRLDPGMLPGEYLLESFQVKRMTSSERVP
jgi:hypothetical protein